MKKKKLVLLNIICILLTSCNEKVNSSFNEVYKEENFENVLINYNRSISSYNDDFSYVSNYNYLFTIDELIYSVSKTNITSVSINLDNKNIEKLKARYTLDGLAFSERSNYIFAQDSTILYYIISKINDTQVYQFDKIQATNYRTLKDEKYEDMISDSLSRFYSLKVTNKDIKYNKKNDLYIVNNDVAYDIIANDSTDKIKNVQATLKVNDNYLTNLTYTYIKVIDDYEYVIKEIFDLSDYKKCVVGIPSIYE